MMNPYAVNAQNRELPAIMQEDIYFPSSQPGVVESGQMSQQDFDKMKGNKNAMAASGEMKGAASGAASAAANGGGSDQIVSSGLIASGNPYAMAAGLGLATLNANQQAKQAEKQRQYEAALQQQQRMVASANNGAAAYDRMRNLV